MKRLRSRGGPFEEQFFFEPEEIDEMCGEALLQSGYLPSSPQPVKIERFIEKHFKCLTGYDDLPPRVLGCTQFNKDGSIKAVTVSRSLDDGTEAGRRRERSTWSHEGGHCLLHPSLFMSSNTQQGLNFGGTPSDSAIFRDNRILCRDNDIRPGEGRKQYDGRWWEWQANRAIGGFLLPKELVKQVVSPFVARSTMTKSPSLSSASRQKAEKEIAEIFDVNPVVARIRIQEFFPERPDAQFEF